MKSIEDEVRFMMTVHEKFSKFIKEKSQVQSAFVDTVLDLVATQQVTTTARDAVGRIYGYDKLKNPPEVRYEYSSSSNGRC